jgi:tungstate transport system ATP-binding protein
VLFLDEATTNLDPASTAMIESRVKEAAAAGMHVLLVTQDLAQARRLSDTIILMHRGRIVEEGPAEEFFKMPGTETGRRFVAGELLV